MGASCCARKALSTTEDSEKVECCTPDNEKCNDECLKNVAATLCAEEVGCHTNGYDATAGKSRGAQPSACNAHLQMAFEQYKAFLDEARCICRSMIERGFKSCCTKADTITMEATLSEAKLVATPVDSKSCCDTDVSDCAGLESAPTPGCKVGCCSAVEAEVPRKGTCVGPCDSMSCCDKKEEIQGFYGGKKPDSCCSTNMQPDDCCGSTKRSGAAWNKPEPANCCGIPGIPGDSCCSIKPSNGRCGSKKDYTRSGKVSTSAGCCKSEPERSADLCCSVDDQNQPKLNCRNEVTDIEKGGGTEFVRIRVTGMTCNGCSENLKRNLAAYGARDIRVNYLQGHADFTIDSGQDLDSALAKTREATGFHITFISGNESLTLQTSGIQASKVLAQVDLEGVEGITIMNRKTVRVQYDPTIIGARDLFHKIENLSEGLAPPQNDEQLASGRRRFIGLLILTIISFSLTIPILVFAWGETSIKKNTKAIVSLVLGTVVQSLAVPIFYKPALQALIRYRVFELDMLVVVSITVAYIYSVVAFGYLEAGSPLEAGSSFETSSFLISLIMFGRLLASYARIRAVGSVSVRSLQAGTAMIVENGKDREIDARLLQYGDVLKVAPHKRIPTDATITSGVSEVDESIITGEHLAVTKVPGAPLVAGTTNGSGVLIARLERLPGRNTITDIAKLVEDASSSKPRVQDIADKVASWFLPVVSAIAIAIFIIWTIVGVRVRNQSGGDSVATAITYAVAVLAITCPCGLGLAVPLVLVIANGIAARGGVIIKTAHCTDRARKLTDVVFDKTGTLTEPDLDVAAEYFPNSNPVEARAITKALVNNSQHPVSITIDKHLGLNVQASAQVTDIKSVPGAGVEGSISGLVVRAGHARWSGGSELPEVCRLLDEGMSILVVARDSTPIAIYGLRARIRADAVATVAKLRKEGIRVHLVSGDQNKAVQAVAAAVYIDRANVASQRTPAEKREYVAALMAQLGKVVLFCGDGTNDAVAVAQADIGVQLSHSDAVASELTRSAADVILLSGLKGIPFLLEISRASFKRVAFNFIWSAVYNVFAILLAAGAFVKVRIAPAYAGAGELVSILPIIIAALTMLRLNPRQT